MGNPKYSQKTILYYYDTWTIILGLDIDVDIGMTFKDDQREQRRGGFYWKGETPYVSVTNILKVLDKPALRYWFGREVYRAMVVDPTMEEAKALAKPYEVSDIAKNRGTTIHSIVEAYKATGAQIVPPEEYKGYAEAFYSWVKDYKMNILEHEKTLFDEENKVAGTMDLLCKNNGDTWVIDVKTGKDIYDEAFLQVSAYMKMAGANRGGILLLQEDGKYKFEECHDYFEHFLATKKIWEFVNREMCKKMGYIK
jgi:hypothetical protein